MNKEELVKEVAKAANVTQKDSNAVISAFVDIVQETVKKGEKVVLLGFGSFVCRHRAERVGRIPNANTQIKIPARKVPYFKVGKNFKNLLQ